MVSWRHEKQPKVRSPANAMPSSIYICYATKNRLENKTLLTFSIHFWVLVQASQSHLPERRTCVLKLRWRFTQQEFFLQIVSIYLFFFLPTSATVPGSTSTIHCVPTARGGSYPLKCFGAWRPLNTVVHPCAHALSRDELAYYSLICQVRPNTGKPDNCCLQLPHTELTAAAKLVILHSHRLDSR